MCTIELTHISTMKTYTDGMSHMVLESEFGYFSIPLAENYGLFGIPMSDGQAESVINYYVEQNINSKEKFQGKYYNLYNIYSYEVSSEAFMHMTDNGGKIFFQQIMDYMKHASISSGLNYLLNSSIIQNFFKSYIDVSTIDLKNYDVDESFALDEFSHDTVHAEDTDEEEALETRNSIFTKIKEWMTNASLTLYIEDQNNISSKTLNISNLPSEDSMPDSNVTFSISTSEKLLYIIYLSDIFSSYTDSPKENQVLSYQLEYILNGDKNDDKNLLDTTLKIQCIRTGLNLAYLYTDSSKRMAARTLAQAAVGLVPVPFIVEFTQLALLSAWAYAEAVIDVRSLLAGNKVPVYKTKETWRLELDDLLVLDQKTSAITTEDGFSYEQYLLLFLFMEFNQNTLYRTMDLIEADMRKNYNSDFRMCKCITAITADFHYNYQPIFFLPDFIYRKTSIFYHKTTQHYEF